MRTGMIITKKRANPFESARLLFYYNGMITLQPLRHASETKMYDALFVHPTLAIGNQPANHLSSNQNIPLLVDKNDKYVQH
jgi:hypothetical protein